MKKLLAAAASILISVSAANATSEEIMLDMIDFIEENSKYEYNGERLPFIQIRTIDELCRGVYPPDVYEEIKDDCSVVGYYDNNMNTIYIGDESGEYMVDEKFIEVVLFHELVHFLQYMNGEDEKVVCRRALERDAYLLQDKYVQEMGWPEKQRPNMLFAMIVSTCHDEFMAP